MKTVKKKNNFMFGSSRKAILSLRTVFSNLFLTFRDLKGDVVSSKSCGSAGVTGTKRQKRAPQIIDQVFDTLKPSLSLHRIREIDLLLSPRHSSQRRRVFNLSKDISDCGFGLRFLKHGLGFPHNGVRGRKIRRL